MSSSRLFLSGLLSSRARLRLASLSIIVDPKHFALQVNSCSLGNAIALSRVPLLAKQLVRISCCGRRPVVGIEHALAA